MVASPKKSSSSSKSGKVTSNKLSENIKSFQKRWNVSWDDQTLFVQFKNRLVYLIDKYLLSSNLLDHAAHNQYAYYCGWTAPYAMTSWMFNGVPVQQGESIIVRNIADSQSSVQLAWYLQNLFTVLYEIPETNKPAEAKFMLFAFFHEFDDLLAASASIQIRVSKTKKGVTVFPAGAKLLDENLVNDNLVWLQDYPEALKAFEQALSIYLSGDKPKFRNLTDNLRVAVEQLLRKVLNNEKSLENQSKELDPWLEKHGVHKQTRNLYGQLLFGQYSIMQNDVAKHGDVELLPDEIEYLIYLTGTFMRLVIQLCRSEV